ncbi:hypothetical protein D018_2443B, partial [Vibrio parahaemolyticus VP2007-007]|jgi:dynamin 1-like protein
MPLF